MSITVVIQDRADKLSIRHIDPDTKAEIVVVSGSVTIYKGTTAVVTGAAVVDVSTSKPGYSRTWEKSTFPIGRYHAEWSLVDGSAVTRVLDQYFEVVKRAFRCPIGESDFQTKYPSLKAIVEANGSTLSEYLEAAWDAIESDLYGRTSRYPGHIFYPEQFDRAAEYWCVSDAYQAITRQSGSEDDMKAKQYRKMATQAFDTARAFVRLDLDDDNVPDDNETSILTSGSLVR